MTSGQRVFLETKTSPVIGYAVISRGLYFADRRISINDVPDGIFIDIHAHRLIRTCHSDLEETGAHIRQRRNVR